MPVSELSREGDLQEVDLQREDFSCYKRSNDLVKIVTTSAISRIIYCRKLLPKRCFEGRVFDPQDSSTDYRIFMDGTSPYQSVLQSVPQQDKSLLNWQILARGRNKDTDKILDWLELGINDALTKECLKTLQFCVYKNDVSAAELIEAYILSFTYNNGAATVGISSVSPSGGNPTMDVAAPLRNTTENLRRVMSELESYFQGLRNPEGVRRVSMHLTYNEKAQPGYNPPGFEKSVNQDLILGDGGSEMSKVNTGHHRIAFKVFQNTAQSTVKSSAQSQPSSKLDHSATAQATPLRSIRKSANFSRNPSLISVPGEDWTQEAALGMFETVGLSRDSLGIDTQPVHDTFARPSILGGDDLNYQYFVPTGQQYISAIMSRIDACVGMRGVTNGREDHDLDNLDDSHHHMQCECEVKGSDDSDLIQCLLCDNSMHAQCYGFLFTKPSTVKVVCYTCLLQEEPELLLQMKELCLVRRVLYAYKKNVQVSIKTLTEILGCPVKKAKQIVQDLEKHSYLEVLKDNGKAKYRGRAENINHKLVADDVTLCSKYFNPTEKIAHFFEPPHTLVNESPASSLSINRSSEDNPMVLTKNWSLGRAAVPVGKLLSTKYVNRAVSSTEGTPSTRASSRRNSQHESLPEFCFRSYLETQAVGDVVGYGTPSPQHSHHHSEPSLETPQPVVRTRSGKKRTFDVISDNESNTNFLHPSHARSPRILGNIEWS